ncbi:ABC transporter ATP-binding protein [Streptomyces sp. NPDC047072]|uniref:ABC transporter ATP-binding protein n=1 Tax=Streptomyces sp. NPDC047072 TaxID=3154809 RepID=UPI0033F6675D
MEAEPLKHRPPEAQPPEPWPLEPWPLQAQPPEHRPLEARPPEPWSPKSRLPDADPSVSLPLLSVRDLRIAFDGVEAVRGVSFDVHAREVFALVGESGAGKSLTARALLGMLPKEATVTGTVHPDLSGARGSRIALVPQDALAALSPVHPVGDQLAAAVRSVRRVGRREARALAVAALERVGIADAARRARAHPHEYSGGMRQRAVVAMATVNEPDVLVADEPTTALDDDHRELVLQLLADQRESRGTALVLVTHDMDAVRRHAHRVLVMYAGRAVETGPAQEVLAHPWAPYTKGLLASLPHPDDKPRRRLPTLPGSPPTLGALPPGCPFTSRCPLATDLCRHEEPEPRWADERSVACHHGELPDHHPPGHHAPSHHPPGHHSPAPPAPHHPSPRHPLENP